MNHVLLTLAFLFTLWWICFPREDVILEMADMESGRHADAAFVRCAVGIQKSYLSLPAISPELEAAAIRISQEVSHAKQ